MNSTRSTWITALALLLIGMPSHAAIVQKAIEYRDGDTPLKGQLVWNSDWKTPHPGVLVVHEWWGLNDYAVQRARQLAELGYVAFAVDMYGDSKVTTHGNEAQEWMAQVTANLDQWRRRATLGLDVLKQAPGVDAGKLAAIGYCFGGATVMQMAYANLGLDGVVSFHGSLPPLENAASTTIDTRILIAHGDADAFIPAERVSQFLEGLNAAGADWQMIRYSGARHGFTNPGADAYGIDNIRYDARADQRSWAHMRLFLEEVFKD